MPSFSLDPLKSLRAKITLLVFGAMVAISLIAVAASFSVSKLEDASGSRIAFNMPGAQGQPVTAAIPRDPLPYTLALLQPFAPLWVIILGYATLIVGGSATVSVLVANMIVRPLNILETAIESVNPQGFIPKIAEKGLGEDLVTAQLLNRLSDRLQSTMESRMRLVAAAGHDLRTPMTRMRLRAEFLSDEGERETWLNDLAEIEHIAESAITLVQEEVSPEEQQIVEIDELVRDIVRELRQIGHDVMIDRAVRADVIGSPFSLKRALSNLMVNAATHGQGCRVSVGRMDGNAVVEIVDSGPGIPDDMIGRAFEPFFRTSPAREKSIPGAGLGLAIVKEIVNRHRGRITLSNRHPHGLYQQVLLPIADIED
ncbi:two-component sensor histidine kinase [Agrobacterium rubi]|nr:two-component sensor histidine kinase [Agrobacterium rubi]NTF23984.1 two-component sensor histidine kinase [Agrobacterium rubi]